MFTECSGQPFAQAHDTAITLALAQLLDMRDLAPTALESHTSHYTLEGLDSPAPPFSAIPLNGLLGLTRCRFSIAKTRPHRHHPRTPSQRDSCHPITAGNHRSTATTPTSRLQPSQLGGTGSWPSCPPHLGPDQAHPTLGQGWQRHARPVIPPQLPPRTPQPSRPRQPSLGRFPVRTARQPCVHHIPLWPRHNIPTAYIPNPPFETPPSRITFVSSPLSVPSHSRSHGRPPFSLCPAGVLRSRGVPLQKQPPRVCREASARVTTNTRLMDLNIDNIQRQDDRRIEVIANGLPLWGGVQLAIDTTLVSPLTRASEPRSRAGRYAEQQSRMPDVRKNVRTPNSSKHDAANLSC